MSDEIPHTLSLEPLSRRPLTFSQETVHAVLDRTTRVGGPQRNHQPPHRTKMISVVIVTFNNLVCTRLCLESLLLNTQADENLEVVVVDNCSTDGTREYLSELARQDCCVRLVLNDTNLGFAAANNQGLLLATGNYLLLLNNDTIVPPGWLAPLVHHLQDPAIGLLGPVTNRIGNEAEIETSYRTYGELLEFAREYTGRNSGKIFDVPTLCMFCLAMRRDVYERLGPLDEQYEVGLLEDDDYSMRARAAGFRVVCAEDIFVHHFGEASFGNLYASGEHSRLLEANRRRFEQKWGVPWQPYERRLGSRYLEASKQMRDVVRKLLPSDATVLVISKGDEQLLRLNGAKGMHFPQNGRGEYAGHHPADSAAAIRHLEDLRQQGAKYLLIPQTAFWWLSHYADLQKYLDQHHERLWNDDSCVLYCLEAKVCRQSRAGMME